MNPQRLVAAVAALAIGFGITLVGVVADDDKDTGASASEVDLGIDGDEGEAEIDQAEQQEAPADEPGAAEVDVPADPQTEPVGQEAESQEGAPAQPAPTSAPTPQEAGVCEPAVIVVGVDDRVVVLDSSDVRFVSNSSGEEVAVLRVSGEQIDSYDIVANAGIVDGYFEDSAIDRQFIDCASTRPITENDPEGLYDDLIEQASRGESDSSTLGVTSDFPCDSSFIDDFAANSGLSDEVDDARTDDASDLEIIAFFLAARIARVSADNGRPQNNILFWQERLADPFVGFRTDENVDDACDLLEQSVDLDDSTREGFFCALGQLSSDEDLLDLLIGQVPVEAGCRYPPAARAGSAGGVATPNEDEGE